MIRRLAFVGLSMALGCVLGVYVALKPMWDVWPLTHEDRR